MVIKNSTKTNHYLWHLSKFLWNITMLNYQFKSILIKTLLKLLNISKALLYDYILEQSERKLDQS